MNHIVAENLLKIISQVLNEWNDSGSIDPIDRDMLLAKIRELYQTVKFAETAEPVTVPHFQGDAAPGVPTVETKGKNEPQAETNEAHSPGRRIVEALYKDGTDESLSRPAQPRNADGGAAKRESDIVSANSALHASAGRVLGEVIGSPKATIADRLNPSGSDIAAKLGHDKSASLRGAIGLNDKYMFVNDLFGGDISVYEDTISKLDSFTCIEDAMIYLYDNHRWNPDSEAAARLSSMLVSKLM